MDWFIDKFLRLYYVGMFVFAIAAVVTIFIRVNGDEVRYVDAILTEQELHEASDSIELVGAEVFQNFNQTKFAEYLVKYHKKVLKEGFVDTTPLKKSQRRMNAHMSRLLDAASKDATDKGESESLRQLANTLKEASAQEKSEEPVSNYAKVKDWFYPVIHRLRKALLSGMDSIDAKNFSHKVFRVEGYSTHIIREEYIDPADASNNFYLDWRIEIEKDIDGFDANYTRVQYTELTAALSRYEDGDQPNYSPKTISSRSDAVDVTHTITGLLATGKYLDADKLLKTYTSTDAENIINNVKGLLAFMEMNAPTLTSIRADMSDLYGDWPDRVIYVARYKDSRFDIDDSILRYTFILSKMKGGFIISDMQVDYFTSEASLVLEDLFFSAVILLTLIWGGVMLTFHFDFKRIIKNQYPATYKKLGKTRLTGHDDWTPYIIGHGFKELGNSTINMYGTHLSFLYTRIRVFLMMMILVISLIKIMDQLG